MKIHFSNIHEFKRINRDPKLFVAMDEPQTIGRVCDGGACGWCKVMDTSKDSVSIKLD